MTRGHVPFLLFNTTLEYNTMDNSVRRSASCAGTHLLNRTSVYSVMDGRYVRDDLYLRPPRRRKPSTAEKWAKKLGFLKQKKQPDDRSEPSSSLVQGEFMLREQRPNGAPGHEPRPLYDDELTPSRLKFRPTQLSFPDVEDLDHDIGPRYSDDFSRSRWAPGARWGNGSNNNNSHQRGHRDLLDVPSGPDPGFVSPVGLNFYYGEDSPHDRYSKHIQNNYDRKSRSTEALHKKSVDTNYNTTRWHPMSHLIRTPSQLHKDKHGAMVNGKLPSFEGPFHVDRGSKPASRNASKKYPAPPPPRPAPSNQASPEQEGSRPLTQKDEDIYEDTLDIEDVLDEMTGLCNSRMSHIGNEGELNETSSLTKWPSGLPGTPKRQNAHGKEDTFYYTGAISNNGDDTRIVNNVRPEDPPVDYSPVLANKTTDSMVSNVDRALPPVPTSTPETHALGTNSVPNSPVPRITTVVEAAPNPPPPPPLPAQNLFSSGKVRFNETTETKPLVELISMKKGELRKTYSSNRKSRSRARTYHRPKKQKRKSTVSSKIGDISDVLERAGMMAPYIDHLESTTGQISMGYESADSSVYQTDLSDSSRNNSPVARSEDSSRSPNREISPQSRFTYLPDGVLSTPRLRRVEEEKTKEQHDNDDIPTNGRSHKVETESERLQLQKKHAVHEEIARVTRRISQTRLNKPDVSVRRVEAAVKRSDSMAESSRSDDSTAHATRTTDDHHARKQNSEDPSENFHVDMTEDEYNKLQLTLLRRLERPPELPRFNMRNVKQYEKVPDPPSELELFFKKRRERQEMIQDASQSGSDIQSQTSTSSELEFRIPQKSINLISRLVELEANVSKPKS